MVDVVSENTATRGAGTKSALVDSAIVNGEVAAGGGPFVGEMALKARMAQLASFNALPADRAAEALTACCASRRWVRALADARPYPTVGDLYHAAAERLRLLDWPDLLEALAAHPRIGERAEGDGREAAWSRGEQSAAREADARTAAELAAANVAYEEKFGHVFLIRATGRTAPEMLAEALARLDHDDLAEQAVVRRELGQIVRLRLDKMLDGLGAETTAGTGTGGMAG
jgi:2-oxo-4-hydroxy-4-carboxy-5-ureidoimidazoline decarboxylase